MNLKELKKIIAKGEDSHHQFKEDVRNGDSLAAEMVAFSNSRGGLLFIGVSNKGVLTGLSKADVDRLNQLISNTANQHVRSPIAVKTENIALNSYRVVIVVTIPEGIDKPYFDHQGIIWLKSGADKRRVNSKEELRRLFQEVDLLHADEIPVRAGVEILNEELLSKFFKKTYQAIFPKTTIEKFKLLENMNLASNGQLNLAGLLLFGNKPQVYKPEFIVKAICFPGTEVADRYLDSEDFEGPIPVIFQGALAFITRNLRKIQKQKDVNTVGELEIPPIVFEELLVNALIHRDYFISSPIRVFIFDDRIEIISPGNLPDHLTVEKIRAGNSIQRNPILASFAAKGLLPYRGLGTGIRRALQDWPKIQFSDDRDGCTFTSTLEREGSSVKGAISINKGALKGQNASINASLSDLQIDILAIVRKNPKISYEELSAELGKDRSTIRRNIKHLKTKQILIRIGAKKTGHWEINN